MILTEAGQWLTALRLHRRGRVGARFALRTTPFPHFDTPIVLDLPYEYHAVTPYLSEYRLSEKDMPPLRDISAQLREDNARSHRHNLELALRRFNSAYSRKTDVDGLLDITIALESCLLSNRKSHAELKYSFALRGATLLAGSPHRSAGEIRTFLAAIYDTRSRIVHDGLSLEDAHKYWRKTGCTCPEQFLQEGETIASEVLKAYLRELADGKALGQVNEDLEQRILRGLEGR
jgi:hypothetical protein